MGGVYDYMTERSRLGFRVNRIAVQMAGSVDLELVTLAGRNPLRSELRRQVEKVAQPFAIRILMDAGSGPSQLNLDRHGRIWWYNSTGAALGNTTEVLSILWKESLLKATTRNPFGAQTDDDDNFN
jgi:hypothetical protein